MNILIVEDDAAFAGLIFRLLEKFGYESQIAETGKDAEYKIRQMDFNLILLDVFLPDTTAHDLIPKMKAQQADIRIITMTGENTEELEREIRKLGIVYYMAKPFEIAELKNILDHFSRNLPGNLPGNLHG